MSKAEWIHTLFDAFKRETVHIAFRTYSPILHIVQLICNYYPLKDAHAHSIGNSSSCHPPGCFISTTRIISNQHQKPKMIADHLMLRCRVLHKECMRLLFCDVQNWMYIPFSVDNCLKDEGQKGGKKERKRARGSTSETHLKAFLKVIHLLNPSVRNRWIEKQMSTID